MQKAYGMCTRRLTAFPGKGSVCGQTVSQTVRRSGRTVRSCFGPARPEGREGDKHRLAAQGGESREGQGRRTDCAGAARSAVSAGMRQGTERERERETDRQTESPESTEQDSKGDGAGRGWSV